MILAYLKHKIAEVTIEMLFNGIASNFKLNDPHRLKVGETYAVIYTAQKCTNGRFKYRVRMYFDAQVIECGESVYRISARKYCQTRVNHMSDIDNKVLMWTNGVATTKYILRIEDVYRVIK